MNMLRHHQDPLAAKAARYEFWRRLFIVLVLAWMVVTSSIQTYGIFQGNGIAQAIRDTQTEGSPFLKAIADQQDELQHSSDNSKAILDQLNDCLQAGGVCYRKNRERTADVISIVLVGVSCSQGYASLPDAQRIEATQQCVAEWLSRHPRLSSR